MPNRIIKETICTSENIDELNPEEEIFFYRLIVNCDDYGRMDARTPIIRAKCFPLKLDKVKEKEIDNWIKKLVKQRLIIVYEVEERLYLQMVTWDKHQQIRAKRSKFPALEDGCIKLISNDIRCNQEIANVPVIQSNPIQSESNLNPIPRQSKFDENEIEIEISKYLYQKILVNDPKAKKPNFQNWAEHIDKLIRIDGRNEEEIKSIVDFCQSDNFWKSNILSTKKLREKFSQLVIKMSEEGGQNGKSGIGNKSQDRGDQRKTSKWEDHCEYLG